MTTVVIKLLIILLGLHWQVSRLFLVNFKTDESNLAEKIVSASVLFVVKFPWLGTKINQGQQVKDGWEGKGDATNNGSQMQMVIAENCSTARYLNFCHQLLSTEIVHQLLGKRT